MQAVLFVIQHELTGLFMIFYVFLCFCCFFFDMFIRHLMYIHVCIINSVVLCCILSILVFNNKELFENQLEIID